jgi:hypothetical protein
LMPCCHMILWHIRPPESSPPNQPITIQASEAILRLVYSVIRRVTLSALD